MEFGCFITNPSKTRFPSGPTVMNLRVLSVRLGAKSTSHSTGALSIGEIRVEVKRAETSVGPRRSSSGNAARERANVHRP